MATSLKKKAAARLRALKKEPLLALSALLNSNIDVVALKNNPPPPPPPPWRMILVVPRTPEDRRVLKKALRDLGYS